MAHGTILEYLDNFRRHATQTAYVHRRGYRVQRWSYGEVLAMSYRFARELEARGIGKGDKVLIWGENCAEWVAAFFGCLLRGAIVVPIDKIAAADFAAARGRNRSMPSCVSVPRQNSFPACRTSTLNSCATPVAATPTASGRAAAR